MLFVPGGGELMPLLCIFFTHFLSFFSPVAPPAVSLPFPPLPFPSFHLFLLCSVARALCQSFLLSASRDVRHCCFCLCLPSPLCLIPPPSFPALLFHTGGEGGGDFFPSPFCFFCVLHLTEAKISSSIKTYTSLCRAFERQWTEMLFFVGQNCSGRTELTRTTCHAGQSWEQVNGIFTPTKEVQHKYQKMACLECTRSNNLQLQLLSSVVYSTLLLQSIAAQWDLKIK